jgi:hypothetical protein
MTVGDSPLAWHLGQTSQKQVDLCLVKDRYPEGTRKQNRHVKKPSKGARSVEVMQNVGLFPSGALWVPN